MKASILCHDGLCSARQYELAYKTAQLETGYEKTIGQLESLINEEATRALRAKCHIFETDNQLLKMHCDRLDNDVMELAKTRDNLNRQLAQAQDEIKALQSSLRTSSRAMQGLKTDLDAKNHKDSDHEHILADRLAISKELAALKQEFDRLKGQNSSHKALIAEKQSLERQLNSLEVQMEEERRAFERNNLTNPNSRNEAQYQLELVQEELKKEVEGRLRLEKEGHDKSVEWENQKKALEERLLTVRKQLRSAKDKLKEYRQSTHTLPRQSQSRQNGSIDRDTSLVHDGVGFGPEMTIATPGAVRIAADTKRQLTIPGEKSAFSITPYLNRNKNTTCSPTSSDDDLQLDVDKHSFEKQQRPSIGSPHVRRRNEDQIVPKLDHMNQHTLDGNGVGSEPFNAGKFNVNSARDDTRLPSKNGGTRPATQSASNRNPSLEGKQNQRKRKVLGTQRDKTLFDDEDEQLERPVKERRLTSTLNAGIQPFRLARQTFNEMSSFSPLKLWNLFLSKSNCGLIHMPLRFSLSFSLRQRFQYCQTSNLSVTFRRFASSKQWQSRQKNDIYTREATVQGLKSRAAFKLLQIDEQYRIFRKGQTVVDLGYAPGSWSQVAVSRTQPNGRVLGVDIIPAQPPKGVSTIQGNFLSQEIQQYVLDFVRDPNRGRPRSPSLSEGRFISTIDQIAADTSNTREQASDHTGSPVKGSGIPSERTVDVVLSDMSAPWVQTRGFWNRSLSNPYHRMMNTSGINFRDHAGSMDLCRAALQFSFNVLKTGGHFVCKFYQGSEDKILEKQLKALFDKVHRLKPDSSRSESREAFFVAIARKQDASRSAVLTAD
ncbi:putative cell division protein ftsj [Talaromyces proteolyticus]|uniref:rRNA methyltransferase 2, mitochondrial n=1 Tax=Talaromyces proteolyticus TaxID=1131652 RepID=A0AAD4Q5T3_9EURO|nr:putative cell division protein ftsj [Talaromyces proteolyticus]KAH8704697.1 putative cell division protein ftsj [Talaromyces proteolyticus]